MAFITLTSWEDWALVGLVVTMVGGIVSFFRNIGTIYGWVLDGRSFIRSRSLRIKLTVFDDFIWHYFDLKGDAVWRTGYTKSGNIGAVRVSEHLCELVGLTEDQITGGDGDGWMVNIHPNFQWVVKAWNDAIEKKTIFRARWCFLHNNGRKVFVRGFFRPVFFSGEFMGGIGTLTEIEEAEILHNTSG